MITENFDNYKTGGSHKEFNIEVVGTDTVIGNTNMLQESITLDEALCSDNNLKFGACEASQFSVQVANIFDDFVDKELIVSVTMDGITTKYGTFKVDSDKPTADRVWRVITCYDKMKDIINANVLEWYKGLTFPMSQKAYRDSFFTYLGIEQVEVSLINDDFMVQGGFTATDTLSGKTIITSICEFNGVFGHINRDGKFDYVSIDKASVNAPSDETYPSDEAYPSTVNSEFEADFDCPPYENNSVTYEDYDTDYITRVTMRGTASDVGTSVGVDGNEYIITNNPIIYGTEGSDELITALTRLLNKIGSISYRPYSVGKTIGNPCVELGDAITVNTRHQTINSYVIKRTLTGIQALRDKYSATGSKVYPVEVNSIREEISRTQGKMNILTRTVDETKSQIVAIQTDLTDNYLTSTQTQTLINQSASQIQATVTQTITAELPDLVDEVTGGLSDRITVVESNYTQLSNEIVMKVKADGTVAQVALGSSAENGSNVLIKGDNIQLDGDVTITDGFRLTAGVIQSANYVDGISGMQINMSDGIIKATNTLISGALTSSILTVSEGLINIKSHWLNNSAIPFMRIETGAEIQQTWLYDLGGKARICLGGGSDGSSFNDKVTIVGNLSASGNITAPNLITTSNIGSQSVSYATDSSKLNGYASDTAATNNTIVRRQGNGYVFAQYFNAVGTSAQNMASFTVTGAMFRSSDGYLRAATLASLRTYLGLGSAAYTASSAYAPASHTHSYLPLAGGTMTGAITYPRNVYFTFSNSGGRIIAGTDNQIYIRSAGVLIQNYAASGYVNIAAAKFNAQSSRLVKNHIENMRDDEAKKVLELEVVTFDYKKGFGSAGRQQGLIAEDVNNIIPSVVSIPDNYDEEKVKKQIKNGELPLTLGIDYSKLVPYLIKMVQIQQIQIDELKELIGK